MLLYFLLLLRVISWFESQKCMIKPYHTITCMVGCLYQPVSNAISFCNTPHHSNFSPFGAVSFTLPLITPVHQHTFGNGFFLPLCCAILRTCLIFAFKFLSLHLKRPFIVNPRQHQGLLSRVAESEVFGWSRSPKNTGNRSRIFFVRVRMSNCIIFYITLLNWEFLLKWHDFFWNFCWNIFLFFCRLRLFRGFHAQKLIS